MGKSSQLLVVLWKNLIIRKYHWCMTLFEILIPLGFFIFVAYARDALSDFGKQYVNKTTYNPQYTSDVLYNQKFNHAFKIHYAPSTAFTSNLMQHVQLLFSLPNDAIVAFSTVSDLNAYYEEHGKNKDETMAVIFNNITDKTPKRLNYMIRPYEAYVNWNTKSLFSNKDEYIPESGSENYMNRGFMALKMALDTSFFEIVHRSDSNIKIVMQEFPYPSHYLDSGISNMFFIILPVGTVTSFVLLCTVILKSVVEEKSTGIKELMKMMGLKSWMFWLGWFMHMFVVNLITIIVITLLMKGTIWHTPHPVLEFCDPYVFFVFLLLYLCASITFCFAISAIFHKPTTASVIGCVVWVLSYTFPSGLVDKNISMKLYKRILLMLSPNMGLAFGYATISVYESREIGATWSNLFHSPVGGSEDIAMGHIFIMFIVDSVLYMLLALYIEAINPGPYGLAKPILFPINFLCKYLCRQHKNSVIDNSEIKAFKDYCKVEDAQNLTPGIQVKNLYKVFGQQSVINGLSLDIYEGQITALLGHNGAGKTTTMSIITGLIGATSGEVLINGKNIKYSMNEIRNSLGLCPQHNLYFSDLTVLQHLIFFGMLKGLSKRSVTREAETLLTRMSILRKKDNLASTLSGGMRRKLSLAISLIGNAKVVILDEPTSGLDPESRREIWDILLSLRGSRTILITTHFMEEADVLGDRIAIMDHGRLMCYGTSMYLKKEFGAGYHLSLIRDNSKTVNNQVKEVSNLVVSVIPKAVLQAESGNSIIFLLPHESKSSFSSLFKNLEQKKDQLGIAHISLSVTTLEEVFLRVGDMATMEDNKFKSNEQGSTKSSGTSSSSNSYAKRKGGKKTTLQVWSLFKKRILVAKKKWFIFVSQILVAVLLTVAPLYLGDAANRATDPFRPLDFDLTIYEGTTVFYGGNNELSDIMRHYEGAVKQQLGEAHKVTSVSDAILKEGLKNIDFYNRYLVVAAEFNKTSNGQKILNAMYSNNAVHGAPISLNLVMNALLKGTKGEEYEIVSGNSPLGGEEQRVEEIGSAMEVAMLWYNLFCLGILLLCSGFILFPHMERVSNIKQLQLMCGIRSYLYWISCYIWDLVLYFTVVLIILGVIVVYGAVYSKMFSGTNELGALFVILAAYGFCVIPYAYLYSYKETAAGAVASFIINNFIYSGLMVIAVIFMQIMDDKYHDIAMWLKYVFFLYPPFGLSYCCAIFSLKVVANYNWKLKSSEQKHIQCQFKNNPCCEGEDTPACQNSKSYFYGDHRIDYGLLEMFLSAILYFTILLFLETNFVYRVWDKLLVFFYKNIYCKRMPEGHDVVDSGDHEDVSSESNRVYNTLHRKQTASGEAEDLLLVHNLQKMYWGQKVVKGVSFGIKPGDCFGLLGVNGAGKTTTFRMLTGDAPLLDGEARIHSSDDGDLYISKETKKYLEQVGYCPQFDALNEVLTGRELLRLFAQLRGIHEGVEEEVNMWIQALGLDEYADKRCGFYSGGNKRKLNIAIALIGSPMLVMLDEPTSGVDPISRRKLWDTVTVVKSQTVKPSIILTSHSMEECEVLCNKLAIMKAGQLECYGTIPMLKEKYGQGFTVMLKLKPPLLNVVVNPFDQDDTDSTASQSIPLSAVSKRSPPPASIDPIHRDSDEIKDLMTSFETKYPGKCTLRDKHSGLLHYHINDKKKKWSELFKEIEQLKQAHPIIEDYNISETTLEEVFLSIARSDPKPTDPVLS